MLISSIEWVSSSSGDSHGEMGYIGRNHESKQKEDEMNELSLSPIEPSKC